MRRSVNVAQGPIAFALQSEPAGRVLQSVLLTVTVTAAAYSRTAVSPLQESLRIALTLSDNQIALLQGFALALPLTVTAIPLGLVIDRYSRVRLLLFLAVNSVIGSLLTALASNFALLFAARCLVGLSAYATTIAVLSIIADLYTQAQRGRANMVMALGQVGGMAAAFALGGLLLATQSAPSGWRWAMTCLTAPLLPVTLLTLAIREPARIGVHVENPSARDAFAELWRYRSIIAPLLTGMVMVVIADGAAMVWVAPTLSRRFALPPDRTGAIMAMVLLVSGIVGPIIAGTLADLSHRSGGPRRTISVLCCLASLSVPAGLFAVAPGVADGSILLILFMSIGAAVSVTVTTLFTIVIPNELRGLCMSLVAAVGVFFGLGLAPLTVSVLSGVIGGPDSTGKALSLVCVISSLLGAVPFVLARRYFPRTA
jgi:MFS family permease